MPHKKESWGDYLTRRANNSYLNKKYGVYNKMMGLPPKTAKPKRRKTVKRSPVKADYTKKRSDVLKNSLEGWKEVKKK